MSAIRGSSHSKYEGLLPIEPPNIVFRPIDLNPEQIGLNPEDVAILNGQRSAWGLRFLIVFCTGVAATLVWSGDAAREMITNSYRLFAPQPALTGQNPRLPNVSAPAAPSAERLNAISFDFDAVGQKDKITTTPTTATSIGQAPPAGAGVTVKSQGDAASSQPTVPLNMKQTELKPPEMSSEKGKPPAERPRGSDHRRERVARKEMVGTTENGLAAPLAPRPQGWSFGLP
jgi:hypothetical protein